MKKSLVRKIIISVFIAIMLVGLAGCRKAGHGGYSQNQSSQVIPEASTTQEMQEPSTAQAAQETQTAGSTAEKETEVSDAAPEQTTTQTANTTSSQSQLQQSTTQDQASGKQEVTEAEISAKPEEEEDVDLQYYTMEDIKALEHTEHFSKSAIEHIFNGSVNSSNKGSGYHYDMVIDSDGEIIDGTRSKEDLNGLYTAYVKVNGRKKDHYSTFFPDSWSPQEVVDAINIARQDALDNNRHRGSTWIGYYDDIEIDMYFDSKDRVVSAFPIYEDDKR